MVESTGFTGSFGYFANATKTWLVTEEKHQTTATAFFANTGDQVTSVGRPNLGAAIGNEDFVISHVKDRVVKWMKELDSLAAIAVSQPHAAHAAFTHGLSSKWFCNSYHRLPTSTIGNNNNTRYMHAQMRPHAETRGGGNYTHYSMCEDR